MKCWGDDDDDGYGRMGYKFAAGGGDVVGVGVLVFLFSFLLSSLLFLVAFDFLRCFDHHTATAIIVTRL